LTEILDRCGDRQIHRTIDTCGFVKEEVLLTIAPRTELFLYDLKLQDTDKHKIYTGAGNELILSNLTALAKTGANIQIRIPLIKWVNSDLNNIVATAEFIATLPGEKKSVNLLPYHDIATHKYQKLGKSYLADNLQEPDDADLEQVISCFTSYGLTTTIGG
jgi:pyruvate formate lyase activating enzyme